MTELEKLERDIQAAQAQLDAAALQAQDSPETANIVHMLRLKLAAYQSQRDRQPVRRRSAA